MSEWLSGPVRPPCVLSTQPHLSRYSPVPLLIGAGYPSLGSPEPLIKPQGEEGGLTIAPLSLGHC